MGIRINGRAEGVVVNGQYFDELEGEIEVRNGKVTCNGKEVKGSPAGGNRAGSGSITASSIHIGPRRGR